MGFNNNDDPIIVGTNNTYKGVVVDMDGNPVVGKTVVLNSGFDQYIAVLVTDENGNYEGQGVIYDTGLQVGIKNDGNFPNISGSFAEYQLRYTVHPSEQIIEISPLIYAPVSLFSLDSTNNTGENYVAKFEYKTGSCYKSFEDDIETYSLCYDDDFRNFRLNDSGTARRSVFALTGSTVIVTLTNDISTITESFLVEEVNQIASMVFQ
jgi:hypothetical protein